MEQKYFKTQEEAAAYLGLSERTFNTLVKNGEIKGERVGTGEERTYFKFSVIELDNYQLERMKKKLGKKFDKQYSDAIRILAFFQGINKTLVVNAMLEGKGITEAIDNSCIKPADWTPERLESLCPIFPLNFYENIVEEYEKLQKDVRNWIKTRLTQQPLSANNRYLTRPNYPKLSKREEIYNEIFYYFNGDAPKNGVNLENKGNQNAEPQSSFTVCYSYAIPVNTENPPK